MDHLADMPWQVPFFAALFIGGLIADHYRTGETKAEKRARNISRLRLLALLALAVGFLFLLGKLIR